MCRYSIAVRSPAGEMGIIKMQDTKKQQRTVRELKKKAQKLFPTSGHFVGDVKLILAGTPLDDDSALLCEIKPAAVLQMVRKVEGG